MTVKKSISDVILESKTQIVIIAMVLFLLEIQIFAVFVSKSGNKHTLEVFDNKGVKIYQTDGKDLTEFKKYYFEEAFGPFENYQKKLVTQKVPFPFRGWFTAAIGIPMGFILLLAFSIRAYVGLFGKSAENEGGKSSNKPSSSPEEMENNSGIFGFLEQVNSLNVFVIGSIIFLAVFSYWVVPNFVTFAGKTTLEIVVKFKWVFIALAITLVLLVSWIIYLRYLLAKKAIETNAEIQKYQLQLDYNQNGPEKALQLEDKSDGSVIDVETKKLN